MARAAHRRQLELIGVRTAEVDAEGLRVDHDLDLTRLHATGAGDQGVIRLLDAHVAGILQCGGAQLTSSNGPVLLRSSCK